MGVLTVLKGIKAGEMGGGGELRINALILAEGRFEKSLKGDERGETSAVRRLL